MSLKRQLSLLLTTIMIQGMQKLQEFIFQEDIFQKNVLKGALLE
jgi:hypothetical protein